MDLKSKKKGEKINGNFKEYFNVNFFSFSIWHLVFYKKKPK